MTSSVAWPTTGNVGDHNTIAFAFRLLVRGCPSADMSQLSRPTPSFEATSFSSDVRRLSDGRMTGAVGAKWGRGNCRALGFFYLVARRSLFLF